MMMEVIFDYQAFACQEYGGVSRTVCEQASALSRLKDISVAVVAPVYCNKYLREFSEKGLLEVHGRFEPYTLGGAQDMLWLCRERFPEIIRKRNPNVVQETYSTFFAPKKAQDKRVVVVHDMIHELYPDFCHPDDRTAEAKKVALSRADHIVCVSDNTARDLRAVHDEIPVEKVSVVHHGVSSFPRPERPNIDVRSRRFILFVGHRGGYKNFDLFVSAAGQAEVGKSHGLVCYGGGPFSADERDKLKRVWPDGEAIQLSGGDAYLAWLYENASLLVYPSLYEGFGLPPLEAMKFGCPVACSDKGPLPELTGKGVAYFDPASSQSMAKVIRELLSSERLATALRQAGQLWTERFSWGQNAREMHNIYLRLINSGRLA